MHPETLLAADLQPEAAAAQRHSAANGAVARAFRAAGAAGRELG